MTRLTPREFAAIDLLADHPTWTNDDLGRAMGITEQTAKNFLRVVFEKYDVPNRTAAVVEHLNRRAEVTPRRRRSTVAEGQLEAELTA